MMNDSTARAPAGACKALLRVPEVAAILGVSPRVAYEWLASGVIPHEAMVRAGRALYVKRRALDAWLAGRDGVKSPTT
jgi:excisionase family DNA binding protein